MSNPMLYFECCNCDLVFYIEVDSIQDESSEDVCCPVCRMNKHMVNVVEGSGQ